MDRAKPGVRVLAAALAAAVAAHVAFLEAYGLAALCAVLLPCALAGTAPRAGDPTRGMLAWWSCAAGGLDLWLVPQFGPGREGALQAALCSSAMGALAAWAYTALAPRREGQGPTEIPPESGSS